MNKVYLHKNITLNKILIYFFSSIFLLIIYGTYKNGILLYQKHLISFLGLLKPLYLFLFPFLIFYIYNVLIKKNSKINFDYFYWACLGLFMPPQINLVLYSVLIIVLIFLLQYIPLKINKQVFSKLLIILVLIIINKYTYFNLLETSVVYSFSSFDLLWGRSIGGICSTSFVFTLICYFILISSGYYKGEIPFISFIVYFALVIIFHYLFGSYLYLNISNILLALVIYGSNNEFTPFLPKLRVFYSILLGLLTFIFTLITNNFEGVFIAILILSCLTPYFENKLFKLNI
jgi:hypothetical protein